VITCVHFSLSRNEAGPIEIVPDLKKFKGPIKGKTIFDEDVGQ